LPIAFRGRAAYHGPQGYLVSDRGKNGNGIVFVERIEPTAETAENLEAARLVNRIQCGDTAGFSDLYRSYFDRVYAYMRVVLKDRHEAEDATQQVFMKLLEAIPDYEPRRPFAAWLFTIARNRAVDQLRKSNRLDVTEPGEIDRRREDEAPEHAELNALNWISDNDLLVFIERLPIAQRQALLLRFMLGLEASQIADMLDRTPDDVRKLQHRALRFLEARLAAIGREPREGRRVRMGRWRKQATVLRRRRYALMG
jgi:RNA polymerase sigma-70 factor (ECF subfamily)